MLLAYGSKVNGAGASMLLLVPSNAKGPRQGEMCFHMVLVLGCDVLLSKVSNTSDHGQIFSVAFGESFAM